jgi:hypothetical protein
MSPENNDGNKGPIENQVKHILSGLGGEMGDFLSQPASESKSKMEGPMNIGILQGVILDYKCGGSCKGLHSVCLSVDAFINLFSTGDDPIYFENFRFSDLADKKELQDLLARCAANEEAAEKTNELLGKTEKLSDQVCIENSRLKVENDVLRRELDRLRAGGEVEPTQTALDFEPEPRRWTLWTALKGFRLIGGGEGK